MATKTKAKQEPRAIEQGYDWLRMPDDKLLDGIRNYTDKEQDAIIGVYRHVRRHHNASLEKLVELTGYAATTHYQVATAKYPGSVSNYAAKMADVLQKIADSGRANFVETRYTKDIRSVLSYAMRGDIEGGHMALVVGGTGRGKTYTTKQWMREQAGRCIYLDAPSSGGMGNFLSCLAGECGLSKKLTTQQMRDRIHKCFDRNTMLIVDEVGRMVPNSRSRKGLDQLEFIRRLHDLTGCPVVFLATDYFTSEGQFGGFTDFLEQLFGRFGEFLLIPKKVQTSEVKAVCKAFVPDADADLITIAKQIAGQPGKLRPLFDLFRQAAKLANAKKEELGASHLKAAHARRLSRLNRANEEDA